MREQTQEFITDRTRKFKMEHEALNNALSGLGVIMQKAKGHQFSS